MKRIFDNNVQQMISAVCEILKKRNSSKEIILYYVDHGVVRQRTVKTIVQLEHVDYCGSVPCYDNTYYGSSQRCGTLYDVDFEHGQSATLLAPDNDNTTMYGRHVRYWTDKGALLKHLVRRIANCNKKLCYYKDKVKYFQRIGDSVSRQYDQLYSQLL